MRVLVTAPPTNRPNAAKSADRRVFRHFFSIIASVAVAFPTPLTGLAPFSRFAFIWLWIGSLNAAFARRLLSPRSFARRTVSLACIFAVYEKSLLQADKMKRKIPHVCSGDDNRPITNWMSACEHVRMQAKTIFPTATECLALVFFPPRRVSFNFHWAFAFSRCFSPSMRTRTHTHTQFRRKNYRIYAIRIARGIAFDMQRGECSHCANQKKRTYSAKWREQ